MAMALQKVGDNRQKWQKSNRIEKGVMVDNHRKYCIENLNFTQKSKHWNNLRNEFSKFRSWKASRSLNLLFLFQLTANPTSKWCHIISLYTHVTYYRHQLKTFIFQNYIHFHISYLFWVKYVFKTQTFNWSITNV